MKNTGKCPKCGGENVVWTRDQGGKGYWIHLVDATAYFDRYICCDCGYTEEWIRPRDLDKIRKSDWTVRPRKKQAKSEKEELG